MGNQSSNSSLEESVMKKGSASSSNASSTPVNNHNTARGSAVPLNPEAPPNYDELFGVSPTSSNPPVQNGSFRATPAPIGHVPPPVPESAYQFSPPSQAAWGTGPAAAAASHSTRQYSSPTGQASNWRQLEAEAAEQAELRMWFGAVDENGDGFITSEELRQALLNDNWTPFNMDTIKMMLKMFDRNMNDRIEFDEFAGLKRYVQEWKKVFDQYDVDHSGTIDVQEIQQAFRGMHYTFSLDFCTLLCRRFSLRAGGEINLDAFIYACAMVNAMSKDHVRLGQTCTLEEFLRRWLNQPAS